MDFLGRKKFIPDEFHFDDSGEHLAWFLERLLLPDTDPRRIFISKTPDDKADYILISLFNNFDSAILTNDGFDKPEDLVHFGRPWEQLNRIDALYDRRNDDVNFKAMSGPHAGCSLAELTELAAQVDPNSTLRMEAVESIRHRVFTVEEIKTKLPADLVISGASHSEPGLIIQPEPIEDENQIRQTQETGHEIEVQRKETPTFTPTSISDDGTIVWDPKRVNLIRKKIVYIRIAAHDSRMLRDNSEQHVQLSGIPRFNHSKKMWELTWFPSSVVVELDRLAHQAIDELSGARALVEVRGRLSHETGDLFALTEFDGIAEGLEVLSTLSTPPTASVQFANWGEPVAAFLKKRKPKHQSPASRAGRSGPNSDDSNTDRHPSGPAESPKSTEDENAPNPMPQEQVVEPSADNTRSAPYDQGREDDSPTRTTTDHFVPNSTRLERAVEPSANNTRSAPYDQGREDDSPTRTTPRGNTTGSERSNGGLDEGPVPMPSGQQTSGRPISLLLIGATVVTLIAAALAALF